VYDGEQYTTDSSFMCDSLDHSLTGVNHTLESSVRQRWKFKSSFFEDRCWRTVSLWQWLI